MFKRLQHFRIFEKNIAALLLRGHCARKNVIPTISIVLIRKRSFWNRWLRPNKWNTKLWNRYLAVATLPSREKKNVLENRISVIVFHSKNCFRCIISFRRQVSADADRDIGSDDTDVLPEIEKAVLTLQVFALEFWNLRQTSRPMLKLD